MADEKKYWDPNLQKWKRKLSPDLMGFVDEIEMLFGEDGFRITSGQRYKGQLEGDKEKEYSHHWAKNKDKTWMSKKDVQEDKHDGANAVDFEPSKKIYNYLQNTKEGLLLMKKYGVALLDETSKQSMEINKSTGAHFHIGKDSKYTAIRDQRLNNIDVNHEEKLSIESFI